MQAEGQCQGQHKPAEAVPLPQPAMAGPSLTFIAGVWLSAVVMVNFVNGARLAVRAVTVGRHHRGDNGAADPHAAPTPPASPDHLPPSVGDATRRPWAGASATLPGLVASRIYPGP